MSSKHSLWIFFIFYLGFNVSECIFRFKDTSRNIQFEIYFFIFFGLSVPKKYFSDQEIHSEIVIPKHIKKIR